MTKNARSDIIPHRYLERKVSTVKLYAPAYYKEFSCIADRCRHSCCVGWEIDVDAAALEKYGKVTDAYGETVRGSIDKTDTPHFTLSADERCPHLDKRGLCRIITALGEEYLCDICREHPRFYLDTPHGKEVGLGMACEEACRLILSSDTYADLIEVGETDGVPLGTEFDATAERSEVFEILLTPSLHYDDKRKRICEMYDVALTLLTEAEWRECLASLEYLDEAHRTLFSCFSLSPTVRKENEEVLGRALAYFLFRHATEAESAEDFRAAVLLSLFFEKLFASLIVATGAESREDIIEAARILSEELEYSEDNVADLLFEIGCRL